MYCSGCGTQLQSELNYCSRCGNRVAREGGEAETVATTLSQVVGALAVFGVIGFVFVILILVRSGVDKGVLMGISFFYLAALFGICILIMNQISASSRKASTAEKIASYEPGSAYLKPVTTLNWPNPLTSLSA